MTMLDMWGGTAGNWLLGEGRLTSQSSGHEPPARAADFKRWGR